MSGGTFSWLVVILALIALIIVLLLRNSQEPEDEKSPFEPDERPDVAPPAEPAAFATPAEPVSEPVSAPEPIATRTETVPLAVEPETPLTPDNLKKIEGIGPKISGVLNAAGISTFAQLAETTTDRVREILEAEDPRLTRLADPTTWAEQAKLAAAGKWDELGALQDELKGGRRV